jgi:hypothetical protein
MRRRGPGKTAYTCTIGLPVHFQMLHGWPPKYACTIIMYMYNDCQMLHGWPLK